ncbi:MAG: VOC family protein [Pirellulaceae bacterium]|jgi:PhnB protein|nr:VOC family protein [Pirellulaceae bacterium]
MQVQPYLYFNGRTEEALDFYRQAIGVDQVFLMRFGESPDKEMIPPGLDDKVMHASFRVGSSVLMASDGMCDESKEGQFAGISLTLLAPTVAKADELFTALSEGGQVQMPMCETFFSPRFGMVADRFGVSWMVIVQTDEPGSPAGDN